MNAKFLFENHEPLSYSWHYDAPWGLPNCRSHHEFMVRSSGIMKHSIHLEMGLSDPIFENGQEIGSNILRNVFYGDPASNIGEMQGLSGCFNARDPQNAQCAINVFDGGGRENGQLSSVWLLGWSPRALYMVSTTGQPERYLCDVAVVIQDWRFVMRLANINTHKANLDLDAMIVKMIGRLPLHRDPEYLRPMFYANSGVMKMFRDQGMSEPELHGIPIREVIELTETEGVVY